MQTVRIFVILTAVLIVGAATVALAYGLVWTGAPMWQAVIGPMILVLILAFRWLEHRKVSAARRAADLD